MLEFSLLDWFCFFLRFKLLNPLGRFDKETFSWYFPDFSAILPILHIDAHSYGVRAVSWCPYNDRIIATGNGVFYIYFVFRFRDINE